MREIEDLLSRYADLATEAAAPGRMPTPDRQPAARRHRGWAAAAAVLVAVLTVSGIVAIAAGRQDRVTTLGVDGLSDQPGREGGPGVWTHLPDAPIARRTDEVAVATDDEMIIWGGYGSDGDGSVSFNDGAAYSFADGSWRTLAPSPLAGRRYAYAVWTGTEVVIWGGQDLDYQSLSDGAAYDPASDTWRMLSPIDAQGLSVVGTESAWTGTEAVFVNVGLGEDGSAEFGQISAPGIIAYDPSADAWRTLPPVGSGPGGAIVASTGSELVAIFQTDADPPTAGVYRIAPGDDRWTEVVPLENPLMQSVLWTGSRFVVLGVDTGGVAIDPVTGERTEVPKSDSRTSPQFPNSVVDGDVIMVGDRWLDLRTGEWHDAAPIPGPQNSEPAAVSHDGRLYIWGGDPCPSNAECAIYPSDPAPGLVWAPPR